MVYDSWALACPLDHESSWFDLVRCFMSSKLAKGTLELWQSNLSVDISFRAIWRCSLFRPAAALLPSSLVLRPCFWLWAAAQLGFLEMFGPSIRWRRTPFLCMLAGIRGSSVFSLQICLSAAGRRHVPGGVLAGLGWELHGWQLAITSELAKTEQVDLGVGRSGGHGEMVVVGGMLDGWSW